MKKLKRVKEGHTGGGLLLTNQTESDLNGVYKIPIKLRRSIITLGENVDFQNIMKGFHLSGTIIFSNGFPHFSDHD